MKAPQSLQATDLSVVCLHPMLCTAVARGSVRARSRARHWARTASRPPALTHPDMTFLTVNSLAPQRPRPTATVSGTIQRVPSGSVRWEPRLGGEGAMPSFRCARGAITRVEDESPGSSCLVYPHPRLREEETRIANHAAAFLVASAGPSRVPWPNSSHARHEMNSTRGPCGGRPAPRDGPGCAGSYRPQARAGCHAPPGPGGSSARRLRPDRSGPSDGLGRSARDSPTRAGSGGTGGAAGRGGSPSSHGRATPIRPARPRTGRRTGRPRSGERPHSSGSQGGWRRPSCWGVWTDPPQVI
jgi:hypothetical protein